MIEIQSFEEITQIRMSREIGGKPAYWVASYLVDGLLIDTGCSYTAKEGGDGDHHARGHDQPPVDEGGAKEVWILFLKGVNDLQEGAYGLRLGLRAPDEETGGYS